MCQNADYQLKAHLLGKVVTLTPGETRLASGLNGLPNVTNRTWEYWTGRLAKAGGMPPRMAGPAKARPRAASAKPASSRKRAVSRTSRKKPTAGRRKEKSR
jgi:HCOMODA/2-hydroxy-3-carboxy-muconic semialdehyde decarboxylase